MSLRSHTNLPKLRRPSKWRRIYDIFFVTLFGLLFLFPFLLLSAETYVIVSLRPSAVKSADDIKYALSYYSPLLSYYFLLALISTILFSWQYIDASRRKKIIIASLLTIINAPYTLAMWTLSKAPIFWSAETGVLTDQIKTKLTLFQVYSEGYAFFGSLILSAFSINLLANAVNNKNDNGLQVHRADRVRNGE